jgi:AraC-like DNA-binding protein
LGEFGVAIEMHNFLPTTESKWPGTLEPDCVEICLNLQGRGWVGEPQRALEFGPKTAGFYCAGPGRPQASRAAGEQHRFVSVRYSIPYLRRQLSACDGALHPVLEGLCNQTGEPVALGEVRGLSLELEQLAAQLLRPPVAQAARPLWYRGKALQLMAEFFFTRPGDDELLCDRQKRVARQRADAVIAILRQHPAEPLGLDAIARKVGCSPFYLSRTFSQETGMTIPQYLRRIRMERAAELLQSGKYNVTEAALEVGYSSLSHFSQAFCQTMGCCPALYPLQQRPGSHPPQNSVKE